MPATIVDADSAAWLRGRTEAVRGLVRQSVENVIETGRIIEEVAGRIGHGKYQEWVNGSLPFGLTTADKMRNVALAFKSPPGGDFDVSAAYDLAAPSVPPAARQLALSLAAEGQPITKKRAADIIAGVRAGLVCAQGKVERDDVPAAEPEGPFVVEVDPTEEDRDLAAAVRLLLPADGEVTPTFRRWRDDEGDPLYAVVLGRVREQGRRWADVFRAAAERAGYAPPPDAHPDLAAAWPRLLEWAEGIAGWVAKNHDIPPGGPDGADIKGVARLELVKRVGKFDPAKSPDGPDIPTRFEKPAREYVVGECQREAKSIQSRGLTRTSRPGTRGPVVFTGYAEGR